MGLLDFFNFKNKREKRRSAAAYIYTPARTTQMYARADLIGIFQMIASRLVNFEFHSAKNFIVDTKIIETVKTNTLQILQRLFYDGYIIFNCEDFTFKKIQSRQPNAQGILNVDLLPGEVILFDKIYKSTGQTQAATLAPYISFLNTINNADQNLIENYGAMGILSPEATSLETGYFDEKEKEELQTDYNRLHGVTRHPSGVPDTGTGGRWSMMVTRQPLKYQPIVLPIRELELMNKRRAVVSEILQFLNIPKELHPLFENAKYTNRNEAELDMYTNCCTAWAEVLRLLMLRIYDNIKTRETYLINNDFWFDIVGVPAIAARQRDEVLRARELLAFWKEAKEASPEQTEYINTRIDDLIENF